MRKKIFFVNSLTIVQFIVTFLVFIIIVNLSSNYLNISNKYCEIVPEKRALIFNEQMQDSSKDLNKVISEVISEIGKDSFTNIITYCETGIDFKEISSYYKEMQNKGISLKKRLTENGFENVNKVTLISQGFYKNYPVEIQDGRNFTESEIQGKFENYEIPIIVGDALKQYFSVGQVLHVSYSDEYKINGNLLTHETINNETSGEYEENYYTYKVVGITEKNQMVSLGEFVPYTSTYVDDDIYIPFNNENHVKYTENNEVLVDKIVDQSKNSYANSIFICNSEEEAQNLMTLINIKLNKIGIAGKFTTVESNNHLKDSFQSMFNSLSVLAVILILFSVIGTMVVNVYVIKLKYKEYGIRLSQGARHRDLAVSIFMNNTIKIILALSIAVGLAYLVQKFLITGGGEYIELFKFNWSNLIWAGGLAVVIIVSTPFLPIVHLYKNSVVELIRGERK